MLDTVMSAIFKFLQPEDVLKGFEHLGWPFRLAIALGILELTCTLLYAIPQTAVLGEILLTGYLGGAIATHVRIEETRSAVIMGVMVAVRGCYCGSAAASPCSVAALAMMG